MMKLFFLISTTILMFFLNSHYIAKSKELGLGLIVGEPTGVSGKYWIDENKAVDFALGFTMLSDRSRLSIHADYIYHLKGFIPSNEDIPFYYGFGVRLRTHTSEPGSFGVRGVSGLIINLREVPVEFFIEAAPVFQLLPETKLKLDAAIGGRYYFRISN